MNQKSLDKGKGIKIYWEVDPSRYRRYSAEKVVLNKLIKMKSFRKLVVFIRGNYYYVWFNWYPRFRKITNLKAVDYEIKHNYLKQVL